MGSLSYYGILALAVFLHMTSWFIISLLKKRNDVADIAWGLGFITSTWLAFFLSGFQSARSIIVQLLVTIWGARLAWHIYLRNKNKHEDIRYAEWRKEWGKWFILRSYLQVFLLQGVLLYLISVPVFFIQKNSLTTIHIVDFIGVVVWIIGFYFESVGDSQLKRFISLPENRGKIMQTGLWKYTRHPNYFGEVTQWWGIFIIALSLPNGWVTIIGPLTITILILFVSGIPLLEKRHAGRPEYEEYNKKTSIFFPLPPKK